MPYPTVKNVYLKNKIMCRKTERKNVEIQRKSEMRMKRGRLERRTEREGG